MALVGTYDLLDTNEFEFDTKSNNTQFTTGASNSAYDGVFSITDGNANEIFYIGLFDNNVIRTFIKNNYDYIFINFVVYFDSIDTNERASIKFISNTTEVTAQSVTTLSTSSTSEEMNVNFLLPQNILEEILSGASLKIKFMIEDLDNGSGVGVQDYIKFNRDISFYAINRFDIQDRGNNNRSANSARWPWDSSSPNPYKYSITTKESTITGEKLEMIPNNSSVTYAYYTLTFNYNDTNPVFSSGYPLTLFFNFYAASDANIDNINIRITLDGNYNNGTIIKEIPSLKNSPVEPDYEFDFRTYSGATSITNTGTSTSTTYTAVGYNVNSTNFDSIEGAIFNNNTLNSSDTGGDYFTILKNGSTQELWSMDEMDFSIELEFIVYDTSEYNQRVFNISASESNTTGNNNSIQLYITNSGVLRYSIYQVGSQKVISEINISSNKLYHVCLTYSETNETAKFYLDGVLIDTYSGVNTTLSNASYFWIGRNLIINTTDYFNGSVRYFRMWTERELTLNEIKMRYDTLRGIHNIYYTTTENISSTYSHTLGFYYYSPDYTMNGGDKFYIDRILNAAPSAANVFDGGVEVDSSMNVTGNIFNSNLIGEIAMFYQNSSVPPFGYLWCDGSSISTNDDEKYRTLIEILRDEDRGSTSVDENKSCYLPDYMIDASGCHLLQADTQAPSDTAPLYTNFNYNYKQNPAPANNIVGNYTLDSDYFPSHTHNINDMGSTSYSGTQTLQNKELNIQAQGIYRFQDVEPYSGGDSMGDADHTTPDDNHGHDVPDDRVQKIFVEDAGTDFQYKIQAISKVTEQTFNADITLNYNGSAQQTTTHIPLSFKVKYAIKYL